MRISSTMKRLCCSVAKHHAIFLFPFHLAGIFKIRKKGKCSRFSCKSILKIYWNQITIKHLLKYHLKIVKLVPGYPQIWEPCPSENKILEYTINRKTKSFIKFMYILHIVEHWTQAVFFLHQFINKIPKYDTVQISKCILGAGLIFACSV